MNKEKALCPKFGFEITAELKQSYCLNCVDKCETAGLAHNPLGEVDVFELAKLLVKKQKDNSDSLGGY